MGDPKEPTPEELSIAGAAADDAERRYQARERGLRAAYRDDGILTTEKIDAALKKLHATGETPMSLPARRTAPEAFSLAGRFRVYFNRHQAAPLVWCIALEGEGRGDTPILSFEIAVAEVVITSTFGARTVYRPKAIPDDEDGMPSAWLEVDGVLRIDPATSTARIG